MATEEPQWFSREHVLTQTSDLVLVCKDARYYVHKSYLRHFEALDLEEQLANGPESLSRQHVRVQEDSRAWYFLLSLLYPSVKPKPRLSLVSTRFYYHHSA